MMCRITWLGLLFVAFVISGCVNTQKGEAAGEMVAIETIYADTVCSSGASRVPKAVWIDTRQDMKVHWQGMHNHRLGGRQQPIPQVDWNTHGIVLIHMGQQITGGYRLEQAQPHGRLQGDSARVAINWVEPPAGAIAAQMITSPCLLLKIQRGQYHSVVIVDQSGHQRASADLPK